MIQDMCSECYEVGFKDGRKNTVLEITEIIKYELHRFVIQNNVVYVDDIVNLLEEVKQNVLCEEATYS